LTVPHWYHRIPPGVLVLTRYGNDGKHKEAYRPIREWYYEPATRRIVRYEEI
jgi:hypothetical protein